ncbi:hypothetical protein [Nocardioides humi]|uniref:Uncharacterized protein n=1 Tax=Nocardioides humi TaxID=449461 RepID=A0ABN2BND6_9ACTN|nr:hypothetical protein [Nocardioides humi]
MSTRRRITVTLDGRVAIFRGWRVAELIKDAGAKPIFSRSAGSAGGWMIDRHRLGDVLAYLEQRGLAVTVDEELHDETTVPGAGNLSAGADNMVEERFTGSREMCVRPADPLLLRSQEKFTDDRDSPGTGKNSPGPRNVTEGGGLW